MPLTTFTPEAMVSSGIVPEHLSSVIVAECGLREGLARARAAAGRRRAVAAGVLRAAGGCLAKPERDRPRAAAPKRSADRAWPLVSAVVLAVVRRARDALPAGVLRLPVLRGPGDHVRRRRPDPAPAGAGVEPAHVAPRRSSASRSRTSPHRRPVPRRRSSTRSCSWAIATLLCLLIGYPFAYFLARRAGRWRGLFLVAVLRAVLDLATCCGCWPGSRCSRTTGT